MGKKRIVSTCLSVGNILAEDIYNENGVILAAKGTIVNEFIKNRLSNMNIPDIYIHDKGIKSKNDHQFNIIENNYLKNVANVKKLIYDLMSGKKLKYENVVNISNMIFDDIDIGFETMNCLKRVRSADEYTYTHCINTAFYSMLIGKWLRLSTEDIKKLIQSGLLHDVGKSVIPNEILNKKGILTKDEFESIKNHTVFGYGLLNELDGIDPEVKRAVLLHHERINGTGYPFNASSSSVGLYARIVAVADVFDAMTSERIYKKRSTPFEAFEMFITVGLGMFDITIQNVFMKNMATCLMDAEVLLNNDEKGRIVYISLQNIVNPIICVNSEYIDLSQDKSLKVVDMV